MMLITGVFTVSMQASCKNTRRWNPLLFRRKLLFQTKCSIEILLPLTFGNTLKIALIANKRPLIIYSIGV